MLLSVRSHENRGQVYSFSSKEPSTLFGWNAISIKLIDNYVNNELYLGLQSSHRNTTTRNCTWHNINDECSQDIYIILYAGNKKEKYDPSDKNWLQNSSWDSKKETVVLIHGYASGDDDTPIIVLKNAYAAHGGYNLLSVDYTKLGRTPCYISNVNNVPYISRCVSHYLNNLRSSGLNIERLTCVGHSLGAVICGLLKNHLKFQLNKIIGKNDGDTPRLLNVMLTSLLFQALDPALPFIFGSFQLTRSRAKFVHVLQTNAGHFGDVGSIGHVNVCVNGGLIQPYCSETSNPNLCSHIWSICYMSQSLFEDFPLTAKKCSVYCPNAGIFKYFKSKSLESNFDEIRVINNVPLMARGTYCLENINPPYCPKFLNGIGDELCCKFL